MSKPSTPPAGVFRRYSRCAPPDQAKYRTTLAAAETELRASLRRKEKTIPESSIIRKARIKALTSLHLMKEPLSRVLVPDTSGPWRGLARIGGGFLVSRATDGSNQLVLHATLSSSYTFARLDGRYYDEPEYVEGVAKSLQAVLGPGIRIENAGGPR